MRPYAEPAFGYNCVVMHQSMGAALLAVGGFEILIIVGFIALFVTLAILGARAARQRRDALHQLAARLRLTFDPDTHRGSPQDATAFHVFNTGSDHEYRNTLSGSRDLGNGRSFRLTMGDYEYTTESGTGENRSKSTHHLSYLLVTLPFNMCDKLAVRPEGFFDRVASAIGFEDIDFESAEFSRRYHVSASDRKVAYDLFDPRMIEWCLAHELPPLEVRGPLLLITDQRTWTPQQFEERLEWLTAFYQRWPEHLVQRLQGVS